MNPYLPLSIQTLTGNSSAPVTQPMPTNAPGAMQYANGASATMVPPTMPTLSNTNTQAPVTTTSLPTNFQSELNNIKTQAEAIQSKLNEPTVGQTFNNAGIDYSNIPTYDELYGGKIDENKVRRQQAKLFQREIDATNQVYDQLLRDARQQNLGSLGSQRAMAARGGLLGSDFGAAQEQKVQQQGNEIIGALQAERTAKIGAIQGNVRTAVADELTRMRTELQTGAKNKLDYMALETEMKTKNARRAAGAFLTQGIDPSTLTPEELATIGAEAGLSPTDIISEYNSAVSEQQEGALKTRKTEAEIKKIEADIASGKIIKIGEGDMLYNTETGETFKNPKTSAAGTGSSVSSLIGTDNVTQIHQFLQSNRGADGYTATNKYLDELGKYVSLGGDPKDFIKEYDPNVYINPNDETRSFLAAYMKPTPREQAEDDISSLINSFEQLSATK